MLLIGIDHDSCLTSYCQECCTRLCECHMIVVDQWRGDTLGKLGHPTVKTPNIDALANQGVTFCQALYPGRSLRSRSRLGADRSLHDDAPCSTKHDSARCTPYQHRQRSPHLSATRPAHPTPARRPLKIHDLMYSAHTWKVGSPWALGA